MNRRSTHKSRPVRSRRNRKRPNWLKIILNVLLLGLVAVTAFLALTSPRLRIRHVQVRGARTIPIEDLRACAECARGSNIFLANTRKVRANVMKNPVVRHARVRKWPANKIVIRVEERVPRAVVMHDKVAYLTDETGFIYGKTKKPDDGLPIIELPGAAAPRLASKNKPRPVRLALLCIKEAVENDLTVEKISVDPRHNICLNMSSGLQIRLGPPSDIEKKLSILQGVLSARPDFANEAVYLDLSCTAAPAWRSKDTTAFPPTP